MKILLINPGMQGSNNIKAMIKNLDHLPLPDYGLFAAKGAGRDIWARLWKARSADKIIGDIRQLKDKYGVAAVYFREDFFLQEKAGGRAVQENNQK